MDEADYAQMFSDRYIAGAIAENAKKVGSTVALVYCEDCGEMIPEARRDAMLEMGLECLRCVDCQKEFES